MFDFRIPGLPDWANLVVLVLGLMIALAWVLMPFSVFGVKGRIEALEARLEVIHEEIRQLNIRIAQAGWRAGPDFGMPAEAPTMRRTDATAPSEPRVMPPVPPPPALPERASRPATSLPPVRPEPTLQQPGRAEPKLSWPPRG